MEQLRERLYKCIDLYDIQGKRTIEISEELQKLINKEMKGVKQ